MLKKGISPRLLAELAALAVLLLAIGLPRGLALGRFVTPDEHLWLTRSANFYYALSRGDYASTFQMGHPGVTIMWAGTAGFLASYPEYRQSHAGLLDPSEFHQYLKRKSEDISPLEILAAGRFFLVLFHTLALIAAYAYARRLLGALPALTGMLLLAFDPFHIALSRVLHLDGLYSNLALLSALAYLGYLRSRKSFDLILSAAAAGLACLTKSPGLFIVPVIGLLTLVDVVRSTAPEKRTAIQTYVKPALVGMAWLLLAAGVFVAAWPAMWVNPIETLGRVFGMAQQFSEGGHESALFFNGTVVRDGNFGAALAYFYPLTYLWRATPLALIGLAAAAVFATAKKAPFDRPEGRAAALGLLLLALVFTAGLTIPAKKFDRYLMPVYPPLDLLAGLGWFALARWLGQVKPGSLLRLAPAIVVLAALGLQAASALSTFPYYFTYYNPLMGGASRRAAGDAGGLGRRAG